MSPTSNTILHLQAESRHVSHLEHYTTPTGLEVDMSPTSNTILHLQAEGRHVSHLEHYTTPTG